MGSFESESSVTIRGSGEATEEIVMTSLSIAADISVELRIAGVLFLIGLPSVDVCSTSMEQESRDILMMIRYSFVKMREISTRFELLISTKRL